VSRPMCRPPSCVRLDAARLDVVISSAHSRAKKGDRCLLALAAVLALIISEWCSTTLLSPDAHPMP
jgi:hypothetical protein